MCILHNNRNFTSDKETAQAFADCIKPSAVFQRNPAKCRAIFQKYESFPRINLNFTGKTRENRGLTLGERVTIISMTPRKDGMQVWKAGQQLS